MNQQINLRLPGRMFDTAVMYARKNGFTNVQDLIKETLRERLFPETTISKKELLLVKQLARVSEENELYGTEEELFNKLEK